MKKVLKTVLLIILLKMGKAILHRFQLLELKFSEFVLNELFYASIKQAVGLFGRSGRVTINTALPDVLK